MNEPTGMRHRVSVQRERVRARVDASRERVEATRDRSATVDAVFGAVRHDVDTGGGVLAGAVAFRIFLFLVPYVFVLVTGLGVYSDAADQSPDAVARDTGIGGLAARAVSSAAHTSLTTRLATLTIATFALFLAARSLFKVTSVVHALVWRVRPARPTHVNRSALVLVGVVSGFLVIAALLQWARSASGVFGLLLILASVAVPFGIWLVLSQHLPHAPAPWWAFAPGAVLVAVGMLVMHLVTVYWIARQVSRKSETYGAIGTSLALLLWAYLLGRLLTASAVVNASLWERSGRASDRTAANGGTR